MPPVGTSLYRRYARIGEYDPLQVLVRSRSLTLGPLLPRCRGGSPHAWGDLGMPDGICPFESCTMFGFSCQWHKFFLLVRLEVPRVTHSPTVVCAVLPGLHPATAGTGSPPCSGMAPRRSGPCRPGVFSVLRAVPPQPGRSVASPPWGRNGRRTVDPLNMVILRVEPTR